MPGTYFGGEDGGEDGGASPSPKWWKQLSDIEAAGLPAASKLWLPGSVASGEELTLVPDGETFGVGDEPPVYEEELTGESDDPLCMRFGAGDGSDAGLVGADTDTLQLGTGSFVLLQVFELLSSPATNRSLMGNRMNSGGFWGIEVISNNASMSAVLDGTLGVRSPGVTWVGVNNLAYAAVMRCAGDGNGLKVPGDEGLTTDGQGDMSSGTAWRFGKHRLFKSLHMKLGPGALWLDANAETIWNDTTLIDDWWSLVTG
jgi:hypothetical protein